MSFYLNSQRRDCLFYGAFLLICFPECGTCDVLCYFIWAVAGENKQTNLGHILTDEYETCLEGYYDFQARGLIELIFSNWWDEVDFLERSWALELERYGFKSLDCHLQSEWPWES